MSGLAVKVRFQPKRCFKDSKEDAKGIAGKAQIGAA